MKQKFIDAHMKVAEVYANLSSAKRLKVGCVIVKDNTIIGIGYNGMPSGWTNDCEEWVKVTDIFSDADQELRTKPEVIHAESNAISKVAKSTNSTQDSCLFVTHAPCIQCAKLIHQSGIKNVFYKETYRDDDGINFLKKCNVEVIKV